MKSINEGNESGNEKRIVIKDSRFEILFNWEWIYTTFQNNFETLPENKIYSLATGKISILISFCCFRCRLLLTIDELQSIYRDRIEILLNISCSILVFLILFSYQIIALRLIVLAFIWASILKTIRMELISLKSSILNCIFSFRKMNLLW